MQLQRVLDVVDIRVPEEVMSFKDCQHEDRVLSHLVDNAIGPFEDLTHIGPIELGNDAATERAQACELSALEETRDPGASGVRVVSFDIAADV
jgi:hypothetical protein